MNYRISAKGPSPTLSIQNHNRRRLIPVIAFALALVVLGFVLPIQWIRMGIFTTGTLIFPAFFVVFGGGIAYLLTKVARARTKLTIDGERVVIELANGKTLELPLTKLRGAEVIESSGAEDSTYGVRLRVAEGEPIELDSTTGGDRRHYDATAAAITKFLDAGTE